MACQTQTASVSTPNGRSSSVMGSSFTVSIASSAAAASTAYRACGSSTASATRVGRAPRTRALATVSGGTRSRPASTPW